MIRRNEAMDVCSVFWLQAYVLRKKSIGIFLRRFPTTTWVQMNWVEQRCVFYFNLPQPRKGMTTTSGSFFRGDDEGGNQDVKQRALYVSKMGVSTRICWLKWLLLKLNALLYKSLTWCFTNSGTVCKPRRILEYL